MKWRSRLRDEFVQPREYGATKGGAAPVAAPNPADPGPAGGPCGHGSRPVAFADRAALSRSSPVQAEGDRARGAGSRISERWGATGGQREPREAALRSAQGSSGPRGADGAGEPARRAAAPSALGLAPRFLRGDLADLRLRPARL